MKKCIISLWLLAYGGAVAWGQSSAMPIKLTGILTMGGRPQALLERDVSPRRTGVQTWTLREGERDGDLEMVKISPEDGSVEVRLGGTNQLLQFNAEKPPRVPLIRLESASLRPVLRLYGEVAHRTVLIHPRLPGTSIGLQASPASAADLAKVIEKILEEKQVTIIADGEKFALAVPASEVGKVHAGASEAAARNAGVGAGPNATRSEVIAPGLVNFRGADSAQAVAIYAELAGRKIDRSALPPTRAPIFFQTQTPLTKEELLYAFDTLFAWQGFKLAKVGTDSLKVVPVAE